MPNCKAVFFFLCLGWFSFVLSGCASSTTKTTPPAVNFKLAVQSAGGGAGSITSSPAGINCGSTCSASFASGTAVTLSAAPDATSTFAGWSGACSGTGACTVTLTADASVTATFNVVHNLATSINHIVFLAQENRSFDHYFGALRQYWAQNGYPDQSFDGLPQFNFTYTGYRVPLLVISPFAKKNFVSHSVADLTAILKLIETRFGVAPLTKRDAAQIDMTEFFDFSNPP